MIGLDTNVIVRYLVQDDPKQSKKANHIIESAIAASEYLWLSQITLCEVVWVLERCYDLSKKELLHILKTILQIQQIRIEFDSIVRQALSDFESHSKVDFSDCLIGRQNAFHGCVCTYTFDKDAAKNLQPMFNLIK